MIDRHCIGVHNSMSNMIETDNAKILTAAERKAIRDNAEKLEQIFLSKSCPVGMITPFPVPSPPEGWLECDGSAISRTDYAALLSDDTNGVAFSSNSVS